ncbi:MAG: aspartyl protease family protein [Candidatus Heimdallarchaeota archaeon]|nr:aspartyl protease family protein [Candidatus Heimdallarchaeota archaeon]MCK5144363.1 aspartyl protease family protein [Candidatus Heimdallarchaeota archaeon]
MKIEFNLKKGINHVFIPVYVNEKGPYNFTLDTGAQATTLSSSLTEELGLETSELIGEKYEPLKKKRNLKRTEANLRIGTEDLVTDDVWTMNLGFSTKTSGKKIIQTVEADGKKLIRAEHPNIRKMLKTTESGEKVIHATDGVLGYTTLKNYLLSVNYGTKIVQLIRNDQEFTNTNQDKMQKFEYIGDTHLVGLPVLINGEGPFQFVVDTRAGGTTISKNLYEKMNLPLSDIVAKAVGTHGAQETHIAIIDHLTVSSSTYNDIHAVIIDENIIGPRAKIIENGILGYNIFKERELIIDYQNQTCAII